MPGRKVIECWECKVSFKQPGGNCYNCPYKIANQYWRERIIVNYRKVQWTQPSECMICYDPVYEIFNYGTFQWIYRIKFFWNDNLTSGYPICPSCCNLVNHLKNFEYGSKWTKRRKDQLKNLKEKKFLDRWL